MLLLLRPETLKCPESSHINKGFTLTMTPVAEDIISKLDKWAQVQSKVSIQQEKQAADQRDSQQKKIFTKYVSDRG